MNKFYVALDLTHDKFEENVHFIESNLFNTYEEADQWWRELNIYDNNLGFGVDIIIVEQNEQGEIVNSWLM